MPSPIAHSVTGYALSRLLPLQLPVNSSRRLKLALAIVLANLPDFDFIGEAFHIHLHRGFTHSVMFLVGVTLLTSSLAGRIWPTSARQLLLFIPVIYGSHLFLDCFSIDGPGMKLLWPFSQDFYGALVGIFSPIDTSKGLFYLGHLRFISLELLYGVLVLTPFWIWDKLYRPRLRRAATDSPD